MKFKSFINYFHPKRSKFIVEPAVEIEGLAVVLNKLLIAHVLLVYFTVIKIKESMTTEFQPIVKIVHFSV